MRPIIFLATSVLIFVALTTPFVAQAVWVPGDTLVPCGYDLDDNGKIDSPSALRDVAAGEVRDQEKLQGKLQEACDFNGIIQLANNIISVGIYLAVLVAVAMFAYAGFLYLTSVGDTGKMKEAHTIFTNAAYGFIFVLGAWLIVTLILSALVREGLLKKLLESLFGAF